MATKFKGKKTTKPAPSTFDTLAALARGIGVNKINVSPLRDDELSVRGNKPPWIFPVPEAEAARQRAQLAALARSNKKKGLPTPAGYSEQVFGLPEQVSGLLDTRFSRPKPKPHPTKSTTKPDQVATPSPQSRVTSNAPSPYDVYGDTGASDVGANYGGTSSSKTVDFSKTYQQALALAQQLLDPTLKMYDTYTDTGSSAISDFLKSMLGYAEGGSDRVSGIYNGAINQSAAIGDAIKNSLSGQAGNTSLLDAVNAPSSQKQELADNLSDYYTGGGEVAQGLAGLSTSGLVAAKAAEQAFAEQLPDILRGQAALALGRFQTQQGLQKAQALNQLPTLASQIASQISTSQYQNRLADSLIQSRKDQATTAAANAETNRMKTIAAIYGVTPDGTPTLQARVAAAKDDAARAKANKMSASQRFNLQQKLNAEASDSFHGYYSADGGKTAIPAKEVAAKLAAARKTNPKATYQDLGYGFFKRSYQETVRDLLGQAPLDMIQKALNRFWTKPGQTFKWEKPHTGRPKLSFQERNPKA